MTQRMVERAERAGFSALVLTVDAQMFGKRLADVRNGFKLPPHLRWVAEKRWGLFRLTFCFKACIYEMKTDYYLSYMEGRRWTGQQLRRGVINNNLTADALQCNNWFDCKGNNRTNSQSCLN